MTLRLVPFALVLAGLLATAPSQDTRQEPIYVTCDLWLHVDKEQIHTTAAVAGALLRTSDLATPLTQAAGIDVRVYTEGGAGLRDMGTTLTSVLNCSITVTTASPPTPQQLAAMRGALATFVVNRLTELVDSGPRLNLQKQIDEQQQRLQQLSMLLAERTNGEDLTTRWTGLQQQRQTLANQLAEARLVLAVERQVRERLRHEQEVQHKRRAELDARRQELQQQSLAVQNKLAELRARAAEAAAVLAEPKEATAAERLAIGQMLKDLRSQLVATERDQARCQDAADEANRALDDFTRTATFALEQLPTNELLLLRTEVRLQALAEEGKRVEAEEHALRERRLAAARAATEADLLHVDMQVARERLLELKGKLARLESLRIDVLSGR